MRLQYTDMHMAGEPVRIVTGGFPELTGATILDKRREAFGFDELRMTMMLEPRGHAGMYGVIPVKPTHPDAVIGVLFMHQEGFSTMCGHATIALGRWVIDQGLVEKTEPVTRFAIEAPCGLLRLACHVRNGKVSHVAFESTPAFVEAREVAVDVPGHGRVITDIAYGGAYYAILPASRFGLDFLMTSVDTLAATAAALTNELRALERNVRYRAGAKEMLSHPESNDLNFFYGTILTDDAPAGSESYNLCVFADGQIDRSPTGSGVTARMALDHAKGLVSIDQPCSFRGVSGEPMTGRVARTTDYAKTGAVIVEVGGQGYYSGKGEFIVEEDDWFGHGFELPKRFADLRP